MWIRYLLCERCGENGESIYSAFTGVEKAHNEANRNGLWNMLKIYRVPGSYCRW